MAPIRTRGLDVVDVAFDDTWGLLLTTNEGLMAMSRSTRALTDILLEDDTSTPPFIALQHIQHRPGTTQYVVTTRTSPSTMFTVDPNGPNAIALTTSANASTIGFSAIHATERAIYAAASGKVVRIDGSTGAAHEFVAPFPTSGIRPWAPTGMTGSSTDVLYVADRDWRGIVAIDALTGACVLIAR